MKILFLGDSLVEGSYGVSFLDIVSQELNQYPIEFINKGEMGDTSHNLLQRLEKDVLSVKPQYVFLHIGVNDAMSYISEESSERMDKWPYAIPPSIFEKNILTLIQGMLKAQIRVVIILPGGIEGDSNKAQNHSLEEYVEVLKKIAREYALPIINMRRPFMEVTSQHKGTSYFVFTLSNIVQDMKTIFSKFPPYKVYKNKEMKDQYYQYLNNLAEKRGLYLTFDGAHHTYEGAQRMAHEIMNYIKNNIIVELRSCFKE